MDNGVIVFVGSGRSGKSSACHALLEYIQPDRKVCFLDDRPVDLSAWPDNYTYAKNFDDIPLGSFALVEDAARVFHSRGSSKDTDLQRFMGVISHKSIILVVTIQNTSNLDLAILRDQDTVLVHKRIHEEDLQFERPEFRSLAALANGYINLASEQEPSMDIRCWNFFGRWNEVIGLDPPRWWSDRNSRCFRKVKICQ